MSEHRSGPTIQLSPIPVKRALRFNAMTHRRLPKLQGGMWSVAALINGEVVGVGIVGHPQARKSDDGESLELLRVAVLEGVPNACSAIYGSVARAARAMGALDLFTFIHADEMGHSLKAAGWVEVAVSDGGEWGRSSRPRQLAFDSRPKRKFAPRWARLALGANRDRLPPRHPARRHVLARVRAGAVARGATGDREGGVVSKTSIEWTDESWNCVRGCSMAKGSETGGCLNCYAARMASRNLPEMRSPMTGEAFARRTPNGPRWTGRVELIPEKLDEPLHWRKPRRVFVNSMSDLFHEALPDEAIARVFGVMRAAPKHTFQILTKRPQRMLQWVRACGDGGGLGWITHNNTEPQKAYRGTGIIVGDRDRWPLPNVWLGVSVENRATLRRIYDLQATPAAKRFVSVEPLLEAVSFTDGPADPENSTLGEWSLLDGIDQVIVGGESGPGARSCDVAWIRSIVRQCREAGVACFVKQLGARSFTTDQKDRPFYDYADKLNGGYRLRLSAKGGEPLEWPEDLRVRDFPS